VATFPQAVSQQPPQQGSPSPQGGGVSPVIKLAMLSQAIQGLAKEFPQGQQGIQMMLKGLQMIQASASAASAPQQPPAPPR
jgi:hypothetical protein